MWKKLGMTVFLSAMIGICGCQKTDYEKQEEENKKEELVIWSYYETQAQRDGLNKLIRDFNQSQNQYHVSWEYVPMTGFVKGLSSAYTENKLPDMAILDNPDTPSMIRLGLFEDITEEVQDWNLEQEYYASIIDTVKYEDKYYGVPFNCNNTALIYSKAMLKEAGCEPPSTWSELRETARKLTTKEHDGFLMCGIEGEQGAFQILSWILAAGENPVNLQENIEKSAWTETYGFFSELLEDGSLSENCINRTQTDVSREFVQGKVAMIQNGPWAFPMLDESGIDYGIVPIPCKDAETTGNASVLGGENIAIIKGKNVKGSLAFLDFCMDGQELLDFCKTAKVLPAKISAAQEMAKQDERMEVFVRQMKDAVTRSSIPQWERVAQKLTDKMYQLVENKIK